MRYAQDWETDLETYRRICLDMKQALKFKKGSKIGKKDMVKLLKCLKSMSKTNQNVEIATLILKSGYSKQQTHSLMKRLKMVGEIFDPCYTTKKEGKYIRLI